MSRILVATPKIDVILTMPKWFVWFFMRLVKIKTKEPPKLQGRSMNMVYFDEVGEVILNKEEK